MKEKLLSCPFCGSEVIFDKYETYMFWCNSCGAAVSFVRECGDRTAEFSGKQESIDKWNTRKNT